MFCHLMIHLAYAHEDYEQRRALQNLSAVLEEAGSGFSNILKVNIFLTTMDNFSSMNEAWDEFFTMEVKPVSGYSPRGVFEHADS